MAVILYLRLFSLSSLSSSKPLILNHYSHSFCLSSPPSWLPLLGQQAPPSHLLYYFFTFNRPRRYSLWLIQSIYVIANNQNQALPPPLIAMDQISRAALIQGISKRELILRPSRRTLILIWIETTIQTCQIWSGLLESRMPIC
jgi:hypothetical protein